METNIFSGLLLIAAGAFTEGSFSLPFGKVKGWKWETYWLIYCFGAYTLFPLIACLVFAPSFASVYREFKDVSQFVDTAQSLGERAAGERRK